MKRQRIEEREKAKEELRELRRTKLKYLDDWLAAVRTRIIEEDQRHQHPKTYPFWKEDLSHVVEVVC